MITDRIDKITLIPEEYMHARLPAPKSVKIELTGRCNYRCGFCALRTREAQPRDDMDFDFFKRITTEMRDAGVEEIGCFYLGESFMNRKLLEKAIRWCKQDLDFPYVFLTSNASLAKPKVVKKLFEAGLDSLKWSVNAADSEQFEEVMGVDSKLNDKAMKNIKAAKKVRDEGGYKCGLYASSIKYDGEQQKKMEKLLAESVTPYVDEHYYLPLYSMSSAATEREAELGFKPTAGNQGRLGALRDPLPCWAIQTESHVTASGSLSACCFDSGKNDDFHMADLNEVSFMEGWNSEKFVSLRTANLKKDMTGTVCEKCVAY